MIKAPMPQLGKPPASGHQGSPANPVSCRDTLKQKSSGQSPHFCLWQKLVCMEGTAGTPFPRTRAGTQDARHSQLGLQGAGAATPTCSPARSWSPNWICLALASLKAKESPSGESQPPWRPWDLCSHFWDQTRVVLLPKTGSTLP